MTLAFKKGLKMFSTCLYMFFLLLLFFLHINKKKVLKKQSSCLRFPHMHSFVLMGLCVLMFWLTGLSIQLLCTWRNPGFIIIIWHKKYEFDKD